MLRFSSSTPRIFQVIVAMLFAETAFTQHFHSWNRGLTFKDGGPFEVRLAGGVLLVASPTSLTALDSQDGRQLWRVSSHINLPVGACFASEGVLVLQTPSAGLVEITGRDEATGKLLWRLQEPFRIGEQVQVLKDEVFYPDPEKRICGINIRNGHKSSPRPTAELRLLRHQLLDFGGSGQNGWLFAYDGVPVSLTVKAHGPPPFGITKAAKDDQTILAEYMFDNVPEFGDWKWLSGVAELKVRREGAKVVTSDLWQGRFLKRVDYAAPYTFYSDILGNQSGRAYVVKQNLDHTATLSMISLQSDPVIRDYQTPVGGQMRPQANAFGIFFPSKGTVMRIFGTTIEDLRISENSDLLFDNGGCYSWDVSGGPNGTSQVMIRFESRNWNAATHLINPL